MEDIFCVKMHFFLYSNRFSQNSLQVVPELEVLDLGFSTLAGKQPFPENPSGVFEALVPEILLKHIWKRSGVGVFVREDAEYSDPSPQHGVSSGGEWNVFSDPSS